MVVLGLLRNFALLFPLSSLLLILGWVRCIYILIADYEKQVPKWFNKNQHRVQLVRHKEIFQDSDALPTYNSHAIEANLYHIEGLARFFLFVELPTIACT